MFVASRVGLCQALKYETGTLPATWVQYFSERGHLEEALRNEKAERVLQGEGISSENPRGSGIARPIHRESCFLPPALNLVRTALRYGVLSRGNVMPRPAF